MDKIHARISALLAKAGSTEHPAERDALLAKAQELMEKYQIQAHELGSSDPIGMTFSPHIEEGPKFEVQRALGLYYGARCIRTRHAGIPMVHMVGPESARVTALLMFDFVWKQIEDQATLLRKSHGYGPKGAIKAVADALLVRISNEIRSMRERPHPPGTSYSIVVVDAVRSYVDANYPDLRRTAGKTLTVSDAAAQAAAGISLNRQVGGALRLK